MIMGPRVRKFALTAHVTFSVGWLGAAVAYIALVVTMLTSREPRTVQSAFLAMEVVVWFVIVPFSLASLTTGLIQSLGTTWGLFRHWWVVLKLLLASVGIFGLLEYTHELGAFAGIAAKATLSSSDLDALRNPAHLIQSGGGLLILLVATVLALYKPRGLTRYGRRRRQQL
jgi:hypothetical protein